MPGGRRAGAGRKKGVPNKDKQPLLERLRVAFPGWHPVVAMAQIANDPDVDLTLRFQAAKEVAKYIEPQRKAIEITPTDGEGNYAPLVQVYMPDNGR